MAKQDRMVYLPHSSVEGKVPSAENALAGQLFINSAAGEGNSFLSTKKVDNTMAIFHEDKHWEGKIPSNLTVNVYSASTIVDVPYNMSSDYYEQNGFKVIPEVSGVEDIKQWFDSEFRQITIHIDDSLNSAVFGEDLFGEEQDVVMICNHEMVVDTKQLFYYWHIRIALTEITGYVAISDDSTDEDGARFAFAFDYEPATPIIMDITELEDGTYSATTVQSSEYITKYLATGKNQILIRSHNSKNNTIIGSTLVTGTASTYINGTPSLLEATVRSIASDDVIDYLAIVSLGGGCAYIKQETVTKEYVDSKINEPIVITIPNITDETNVETEVGKQGETTQIFGISGESFYETIGAESGITCDEYYALLQKSLVLINGGANTYNGSPMIAVPYIEHYDNNEIMLTVHVHNWTGGVEGTITNSMADLLVSIDFNDEAVNFALTQWLYDEAHMSAPYKIGITSSFNNRNSPDEDLIISMQLRDYNGEAVTSKFVIDLLKEGKRVIFGSWDTDDEWTGTNGEYDVWAYSDNQIVIRWTNMNRGKSVNSTHYFAHSYSILVFDTNGYLEYNDTTDTPVKGCVYYYKPIMAVKGDDYVTAEVKVDTTDNVTPTLYVNTNIVSIDGAKDKSGNTVNGVAASLDVREHFDNLSGRIDALENSQNTYELTIDDDGMVRCIKNGTEEGFAIDDEGMVSLA